LKRFRANLRARLTGHKPSDPRPPESPGS